MNVRSAQATDHDAIARLVAEFRVELASLHNRTRQPDLEDAKEELKGYRARNYPIFVAEGDGSEIVGYLVCRVGGDVVWAESLYVLPEFRRRGTGSALYGEAECLAKRLGGETVYSWVHPNNDKIIGLLKKRGYSVLNLIELRGPRPGEQTIGTIQVGQHEFDY